MIAYIFMANLGIPLGDGAGYVKADSVDAILAYDAGDSRYKSVILIGNRQFRSFKSPLEVVGVIKSYINREEI